MTNETCPHCVAYEDYITGIHKEIAELEQKYTKLWAEYRTLKWGSPRTNVQVRCDGTYQPAEEARRGLTSFFSSPDSEPDYPES